MSTELVEPLERPTVGTRFRRNATERGKHFFNMKYIYHWSDFSAEHLETWTHSVSINAFRTAAGNLSMNCCLDLVV
jgi:hypothetical protein